MLMQAFLLTPYLAIAASFALAGTCCGDLLQPIGSAKVGFFGLT